MRFSFSIVAVCIFMTNCKQKDRSSTMTASDSFKDTTINITFYRDSGAHLQYRDYNLPTIESTNSAEGDAITLGVGVNSKTGKVKRKCLQFTPSMVRREQVHLSGSTYYSMKIIESAEDITRNMGLNVKASLGWGFFKAEGVSRYFEESNYNSYSLYIMINVTTQLPSERIEHIRLDKHALSAAGRLEYATWLGLYGNEIVTGINKGGQLTILLTLNTNSQKEYNDTYNSLKADLGGLFFSASAEEEYKEKVIKLKSHKYSDYAVFRVGDDSSSIPRNSLDSVIQYSLSFPERVYKNPSLHSYIMQDITNAENFPKRFEALKNPYLTYNFKVDSIAENLIKAKESLGNIKYYTSHKNSFVNKSIETDDPKEKLQSYITKMNQYYESCLSGMINCDQVVGVFPKDLRFKEKRADSEIEPPIPEYKEVVISPSELTLIGHVPFGKLLNVEFKGAMNLRNNNEVRECVDIINASEERFQVYNILIIVKDPGNNILSIYRFDQHRRGNSIPILNSNVNIYVKVEERQSELIHSSIAGPCQKNPLRASLY
jgi:hypothetical protein